MKRVGKLLWVGLAVMALVGCKSQAEREKEQTVLCKEGKVCKEQGLCTGHCEGAECKCIVGSAADCKPIARCATMGHCSAVDGKCAAANDADCKQSGGCKTNGRCAAKAGECVAGSAEGCKQSELCKEEGKCTASTGKCVAATDADCQMSKKCHFRRKCEAKKGDCVHGTKIPPAPDDVSGPPSDAEKTESGLTTKVLEKGLGKKKPGPSSRVLVHYAGWKTDGKMFDSSYRKGRPASFTLDAVIPGWTEALQLMVEGEKRRLWIPQNLAYQGKREPHGMLVFDVELVEVIK